MAPSLTHIIILMIILLLFFGPSRLPDLGKSLGEAIRGFKGAMDEMNKDDAPQKRPPAQAPQPVVQSQTPNPPPNTVPLKQETSASSETATGSVTGTEVTVSPMDSVHSVATLGDSADPDQLDLFSQDSTLNKSESKTKTGQNT